MLCSMFAHVYESSKSLIGYHTDNRDKNWALLFILQFPISFGLFYTYKGVFRNMVASPPPPPPPPPGPYNPQNPHSMENGSHPVKAETPALTLILKLLNGVTHFLLGAVAFSGFYYATFMLDSISIGSWVITYPASYSTHIFLNISGYIILMSQAMLVYNPFGGCATSLQYNHKRILHLGLQIVGSFLAIVGSTIKLIDEDTNFYSAHSFMGFFALLLTVMTLIGGVVNFVCCQRSEVLTWKLLHACLGALTVTMAFMALIGAYIIYFPDDVLSISVAILALIGFLISAVHQIFRKHLIIDYTW